MTIEIRTQTGQDSLVAEAAQELLELVGGEAPKREILEPDKEPARFGDPLAAGTFAVAVATLILTIPGALNETLDLLNRPKVAAAVKKLLEAVKQEKSGAFLIIEGKPMDLSNASEDEILDLLDQSLGK